MLSNASFMNRYLRRRGTLTSPFALFACAMMSLGAAVGAFAAPKHSAGDAHPATAPAVNKDRRKEGEVLRIFDRARVYVVTNDDAHLADLLLEGANHKERRILTLDEWNRMPDGIRRYVSVVFLINRQYLPLVERIPENCDAVTDELFTRVSRLGYSNGVSYEVVLSAPDGAWLRQAILDFRKLKEAPRGPQKRNVRSLAIIPIGAEAARAATPLLEAADPQTNCRAHLLPAMNYPRASLRVMDMDELFLIDRSAINDPSFAGLLMATGEGKQIGAADTAIWRERKPNGRFRVFISAPEGEHLREALRQYPDPLTAPGTVTVLNSAQDLREVRRVAVVGVKSSVAGTDVARRLATIAATNLRTLNAFEVLERAALSEILGEIALGQAGITEASDRQRVRQLAAADALLLVEVTSINGETVYAADYKRLTGKMGPAPRRPLEPSRLRFSLAIPGKEDDPIIRVLSESLLKRAVGEKDDDDYRRELNAYNRIALPQWREQRELYEQEKRSRIITWEQKVRPRSTVTVTGSLRLVNLEDGMVLWEFPFAGTGSASGPEESRRVTTQGEDSKPGNSELPKPENNIPPSLLVEVTDKALVEGIQQMRSTALLPDNEPIQVVDAKGNVPFQVAPAYNGSASGKILDIDGKTVLIGLGASDGIQEGSLLTVTLPDGAVVRLTVKRVRPRTLDAVFSDDATVSERAKITVGMAAVFGEAPVSPAAPGTRTVEKETEKRP
ncbi:MAG: hypothetical protein OHK0029_01310 [Armatimonadaceae bacterium]